MCRAGTGNGLKARTEAPAWPKGAGNSYSPCSKSTAPVLDPSVASVLQGNPDFRGRSLAQTGPSGAAAVSRTDYIAAAAFACSEAAAADDDPRARVAS